MSRRRTLMHPSSSNGSTPATLECPKSRIGSVHSTERHDNPEDSLYPLSYSPSIVGLDILDHVDLMQFRKTVTWLDFGNSPPERTLDLGCGTGAWVLDAARQWPHSYFVGYDIAKIQPSRSLLPLMISERVCWLNGNFLKEKLPFDDNFFDYVHISQIAWGVPEHAWDGLFEEIARVLRPGGVVEIAEEDILFPTLPRSYTLKTKQARPTTYIKKIDSVISISPLHEPTPVPHAHALIESLFFGVFETRMINLRPTSIIPHHLNIHFRKVTSTTALEFPFPPPPLSRLRLHDTVLSESRPQSQSYSSYEESSSATSSLDSSDQGLSSFESPDSPQARRTRPLRQVAPPQPSSPFQPTRQQPTPTLIQLHSPSSSISEPVKFHEFTMGCFKPTSGIALIPPVTAYINRRDLALQLNTVYQRIMACKESMWTELRRRLALRRGGMVDLLSNLGWDEEAEGIVDESLTPRETQERALFEEFMMRFERDMRYRTALSDSIETALGWQRPPPAPMSKYERQRAMELESAVIEAAKAEAHMDMNGFTQFSRSCKTFIGFKEVKKS